MSNTELKENEIRPADLMRDQHTAMIVDIGRLLQHADKFIPVNCPACEKDDADYQYQKYGMRFVECKNCNTMYTNPRPTAEVLEEFYKDSVNYSFWNKNIFPASENIRRKKIFVPRVDKTLEICKKYNVQNNSLLEIGAAFGTFCVEMKSRNYFKSIVAVEPTPTLAATCRGKGLEVIEEVIENIEFSENEKFDVIVNFEVIEHIFSPKDFILNCKKLLKPGGLMITTCPNGQGFDFKVLKEKCNSVDHEHLNYFNPHSLGLLLGNSGFKVLESHTPGKLDAELVRKKILSGEYDVSQHSFLNQVLIEKWEEVGNDFQKFLADSGLSSNLWIVAQLT
jgi:2-polyprenyl-3-methyl-5-hydroxy-6-metoxy-1,4-benzoquinol methylase